MDFKNHTVMHLAEFVVHADHDFGLTSAGEVATIASNKRKKNAKLMSGNETVNKKLFYWHMRTRMDANGSTRCICEGVS